MKQNVHLCGAKTEDTCIHLLDILWHAESWAEPMVAKKRNIFYWYFSLKLFWRVEHTTLSFKKKSPYFLIVQFFNTETLLYKIVLNFIGWCPWNPVLTWRVVFARKLRWKVSPPGIRNLRVDTGSLQSGPGSSGRSVSNDALTACLEEGHLFCLLIVKSDGDGWEKKTKWQKKKGYKIY